LIFRGLAFYDFIVSPIGKKLEDIEEADLTGLIDAGVAESRIIEYKAQLPGRLDADKKEFLKDVASFVNSDGGWIIYGIEEKDGLAGTLAGIPRSSVDIEKRRLEQIIRGGIEPIIHGLRIVDIPLTAPDRSALILEIPRGLFGPHLIKGRGALVRRASAMKVEMDFGEIRSAFVGAESAVQTLKAFREDRLARMLLGEPNIVKDVPTLVIHILPLASFSRIAPIEIERITRDSDSRSRLVPMWPTAYWKERFTFDGFMRVCAGPDGTKTIAYSSLFRNGALEVFDGSGEMLVSGLVYGIRVEFGILSVTTNLLPVLGQLEIPPPYYVLPSLLNVHHLDLLRRHDGFPDHTEQIDREHLFLPETIIENLDAPLELAFKPAFDVFWNSAGYPGSPYYHSKNGYPTGWKNRVR